MKAGTLYLVGTPIGNLEDITLRAIRILAEVDVIASEDTRRTAQLLNHLEIKKPLISYYEQNKDSRTPELLARMSAGESVALVSDAGLPGIADPGMELVAACHASGITVSPVPGANAALSALICSGMDTRRFTFLGFLPRTDKKRRELLESFVEREETLIVYEAPHRVLEVLGAFSKSLGNRQVVIGRELTKKFEEFRAGTVDEHIDYFNGIEPRGEFVLVVAGANGETVAMSAETINNMPLLDILNELLVNGVSRNEALRTMTQKLGISKRELYKKIEQLKAEEPI
ncbi:MAG: 16S rRNA (cytidine(1402)-2'-O)-methyltransferase [Negativicutes bacterium]